MQKNLRLYEQFVPEHYSLTFSVFQDKPDFQVETEITGTQVHASEIRLHAKELQIESVNVNSQPAEFRVEDDQLVIASDGAGEVVVVEIISSAPITDPMYGIYPCYYTENGEKKKLIATQFEPNDAERVFPSIDEPEAKATFDVRVRTSLGQLAISNMPIKEESTEGDIYTAEFETTPRMSTYLLALIVGDLQRKTTQTANGTEVNVYATKVHSPASLDFALDEAVKSLEIFERKFGVPYPLPKSDHIALPDFSSGAMENWGAVTYRESALLADPETASIDNRKRVSTVIAHELSHQWFGNLVTMKWWNNLWLNESFASIMEYEAPNEIHPDWNIWLDFSTQDAVAALRRDAIDGVQSVQVDVNHPDEINSLFDGAIVYAKGARLMRMMQLYLGDESFYAGLKDYFTKHQSGNTTEQDLWDALSAASGKDVGSLMNTWISQSGYPVVSASLKDGHITLSQQQFFVGDHAPSDKLWPIPLDAANDAVPELFTDREMTFAYDSDDVFELNTHDSAHFITHYDDELLEALLTKVKSGSMDVVARTKLLNEHIMLARGGIIPSADLLKVVAVYENETDARTWQLMSAMLGEMKKFVERDSPEEQKLRQLTGKLSRNRFEALGWEPREGESENDTLLRPLIINNMIYSEDRAVIDEAIRRARALPFEQLDPELRDSLVSADVRHGDNPNLIDELIEKYKIETDPALGADLRGAITTVRTPEQVAKVMAIFDNMDVIRPQDHAHWYIYMLMNREARDTVWQWVQGNWDWVEARFKGDKNIDAYPRYAGQTLSTAEQLQQYKDFFGPMKNDPSLGRNIEIGMTDIAARVELIERDAPLVRERLREL